MRALSICLQLYMEGFRPPQAPFRVAPLKNSGYDATERKAEMLLTNTKRTTH